MRRISTKRKKELYSISSLLFHLLVFIVLLISLGTDTHENIPVKESSAMKDNSTLATKKTEKPFEALFTSIKR